MTAALWITLISAILLAIFGTGTGLYGWFKLGAERRKTSAEADEITAKVHTAVLRDLNEDYDRLADEVAQLRMAAIMREKENSECRQQLHEMRETVASLRIELARHGRLAELSRRKAHLALNMLGNFEIHIDNLLGAMRDHVCQEEGEHGMHITPLMRPHKLREAFQFEMNKLEQAEIKLLDESLTEEPDAPV